MVNPTAVDLRAKRYRYRDYALPFLPLLLAPIALGISQYAQGHPVWAERYIQTLNRLVASPVSRALGIFPFSVAEIFLALFLISFVIECVIRLVTRDWIRLVAGPLAAASVFYALFAGGWGVAYAREPYAFTAGLTVQPVTAVQLNELCESLIAQANAIREKAPEDEQGVYKTNGDGEALLRRVGRAYDKASAQYPWLAGEYGNPKPVLMSEAMSYLQITGIFIPFTFEANVNMNNLACMIPMTACHEAAHLRGWAREDEANYVSFAVCLASGDNDFVYSGLLLGIIHAMNALASADGDLYWETQSQYGDGLRRDLAVHYEHWQRYEGKVSEVQEQINDAYLKVNRQEDGVKSYGRMVDLMVAAFYAQEDFVQ